MEQQNKTHFLDGRFIVLSRLGDGGSASVWRVLDTKYDVERAIKILHISGGPTTLQRFEQEVIIMMQLNSANIVTVYESFVEEEQLHVVMEKCTGSLNTWSQMHGRMPPRLAVKVVIEILKGLEKAHNKGVVHRDIKPHNILIDEDGGVKIADFGLALFYLSPESLTKTGALLGSLAFMSPEQRLNPTDVSPATDIYSTTMTLAWLLENQSVPDLYLPETIEDLRSRHASALVDVMERGGRHKPTDRYASAKEMKEALKAVESMLPDTEHSLLGLQLVEVSIQDLMPSPSQPVITENQSMELKALNSVRWMLVVVVLLLVGIAGAVIWQLQGRDAQTGPTVVQTELTPDVPMCSAPIRSFTRLTKVGPQESVQTAFEDLNQDGRTDAIFVNQYSQTMSIYWGNEAYEMQEPLEIEYARSRSRPIVADFNRDGQLDMVSSHIDLQRIQTHYRLSDTEWRTPSEDDGSILLQIPPPRGGMAYDGNGDGHLDLYLVAQNIADVTYQILVRTAKAEGGFNNHEVLTSMPTNPVMDPQYPNVYWFEEGVLFHKDVLKLSQAPTSLAEGLSGLKVQQAIRNRRGDVEVMMLDAQGTIYRWSELEGVCQLSENALGQYDTMYEESFGYWNDDDIIDVATTRTCMYCTSNHTLLLGN